MMGFWCHTGGTEGSGTGYWTVWSEKWMGWTGQGGGVGSQTCLYGEAEQVTR